ncbi:unnamed protein product [Heligmosomoides polygyrus]|uniref:Recep_L_domain domain-containing protein n=1 Tax=Heligmosomoides polygyrus TaxID=6339 RepID=A0A183FRL8_HELPZ|nr:unnamed protein product [Heligmosomoides polygyrus]
MSRSFFTTMCATKFSEVDYDCYFYGGLPAYLEEPWKPQCRTLYGRIVINAESNLTEARLEELFRNITSVVGKVAVEQTLLKRLTFLKNVAAFSTLAISENALLTQLSLDKLNSSDGKIVVVRNPLLNMSKLCDRMDKISNGYRMIAGNKADCGESSTG